MHSLKIDLVALGAAFDARGPGVRYLDLETGGIVVRMLDEPAPGESDKYNIEPERYLPIEPLAASQQLALRETFLASVSEPQAHAALAQALAGRKPLRAFSYALEQFPEVHADWLAYQARLLHEHALDWLQDNGLESTQP